MNAETLRIWTARLLLGFVLVTVGFSIGRKTAPAPAPEGTGRTTGETSARTEQVVVYAAHTTFRCPECIQIEQFTRELIESEFAAELADGRLAFHTLDYMRDPVFARRYNISSSVVVVSRLEDGAEQEFQRLDEVWAKVGNRDDFRAYVRNALRESLGKENRQ